MVWSVRILLVVLVLALFMVSREGITTHMATAVAILSAGLAVYSLWTAWTMRTAMATGRRSIGDGAILFLYVLWLLIGYPLYRLAFAASAVALTLFFSNSGGVPLFEGNAPQWALEPLLLVCQLVVANFSYEAWVPTWTSLAFTPHGIGWFAKVATNIFGIAAIAGTAWSWFLLLVLGNPYALADHERAKPVAVMRPQEVDDAE